MGGITNSRHLLRTNYSLKHLKGMCVVTLCRDQQQGRGISRTLLIPLTFFMFQWSYNCQRYPSLAVLYTDRMTGLICAAVSGMESFLQLKFLQMVMLEL